MKVNRYIRKKLPIMHGVHAVLCHLCLSGNPTTEQRGNSPLCSRDCIVIVFDISVFCDISISGVLKLWKMAEKSRSLDDLRMRVAWQYMMHAN